jgi:uncharacterized protein YecE (DUF72 family)
MILRIGTSGYSYKEWKGVFYPENLKPAEMLSFYAARLGTVEINNTFYHMPTPKVLEGWASQVPETFRFVLKTSQKITHYKRLKGVEEEAEYVVRMSRLLGARLGALLVQIPPNLARDDERLSTFLDLVSGVGLPRYTAELDAEGERVHGRTIASPVRVAFEVRHPSWLEPAVFAILEKHDVALVASQTDEEPEPRLVRTAPWGYLRLRKTSYTPAELSQWSGKIAEQGWDEAFVFFKHEQIGPDLAQQLSEAAAGAPKAKRKSAR